jgi:hypothetical protein
MEQQNKEEEEEEKKKKKRKKAQKNCKNKESHNNCNKEESKTTAHRNRHQIAAVASALQKSRTNMTKKNKEKRGKSQTLRKSEIKVVGANIGIRVQQGCRTEIKNDGVTTVGVFLHSNT